MEFFCQQIFWILSKAEGFVTTFQASLSFHILKHTKSPLFVRTPKILREKPRLESANSSNRQIRRFRSAAVFPGNGDTKSLYTSKETFELNASVQAHRGTVSRRPITNQLISNQYLLLFESERITR